MGTITARLGDKQFCGTDFAAEAAKLGYDKGAARQAWRTVQETARNTTYSVLAAYDKTATHHQLANLLKAKPASVSEEEWQLIVKVSGRLLLCTVTRKEFQEFGATMGASMVAVGSAWNMFIRTGTDLGELPADTEMDGEVSVECLESFCERMEDTREWPQNYGPSHDHLLRLWLRFITQ